MLCIEDAGDQNEQHRHQYPKIVTNTFRPQHLSPTSMWPINIFITVTAAITKMMI